MTARPPRRTVLGATSFAAVYQRTADAPANPLPSRGPR